MKKSEVIKIIDKLIKQREDEVKFYSDIVKDVAKSPELLQYVTNKLDSWNMERLNEMKKYAESYNKEELNVNKLFGYSPECVCPIRYDLGITEEDEVKEEE